MPAKLWKVHGPLKLWNEHRKVYQNADRDEMLEEVPPGTTASPDDIRVYRGKETGTILSYIVSREALEANATPVSE
jgi:hypothetical protein